MLFRSLNLDAVNLPQQAVNNLHYLLVALLIPGAAINGGKGAQHFKQLLGILAGTFFGCCQDGFGGVLHIGPPSLLGHLSIQAAWTVRLSKAPVFLSPL